MSEPFNPPRLSDRLAVAAAKPPPPVIVHADGRQKVPNFIVRQRQVAKNKQAYARKRLREVPHLKTKDLNLEILKKFGSAMQTTALADIRHELGARPRKQCARCRRKEEAANIPQGASVALTEAADVPDAPNADLNMPTPQPATQDITVHHALRRVLDHMRKRGIERLVLFDTGFYDIHNRQRSVFEPDA